MTAVAKGEKISHGPRCTGAEALDLATRYFDGDAKRAAADLIQNIRAENVRVGIGRVWSDAGGPIPEGHAVSILPPDPWRNLRFVAGGARAVGRATYRVGRKRFILTGPVVVEIRYVERAGLETCYRTNAKAGGGRLPIFDWDDIAGPALQFEILRRREYPQKGSAADWNKLQHAVGFVRGLIKDHNPDLESEIPDVTIRTNVSKLIAKFKSEKLLD